MNVRLTRSFTFEAAHLLPERMAVKTAALVPLRRLREEMRRRGTSAAVFTAIRSGSR